MNTTDNRFYREPAEPHPVDRARVEALTAKLLGPVRAELARQPYSRDNVFVALNALAGCTAVILAGTEGSLDAQRFFHNALSSNFTDLRRREH